MMNQIKIDTLFAVNMGAANEAIKVSDIKKP